MNETNIKWMGNIELNGKKDCFFIVGGRKARIRKEGGKISNLMSVGI